MEKVILTTVVDTAKAGGRGGGEGRKEQKVLYRITGLQKAAGMRVPPVRKVYHM